jgi:lipopolysaccharide export LptBFGC system permease protein LptF
MIFIDVLQNFLQVLGLKKSFVNIATKNIVVKSGVGTGQTIDSYFFKQNMRIFLMVFCSIIVFFCLTIIIGTSGFVVKYQISYNYVLQYILLLLIKDIDRVIPFAVLISCWIFLNSIRSQVVIINNCGVNNLKITRLIAICYVPVFIILFYLSFFIRPQSKVWIDKLESEIKKTSIIKFVKEKEMISGAFFDLYIEKFDKKTTNMNDVIIRLYNPCENVFVAAKSGFIKEGQNAVYLALQDCKILSWGTKENCQVASKKSDIDKNPSLFKSFPNIQTYKFEIKSEQLILNLDAKRKENIEDYHIKMYPTVTIIKMFIDGVKNNDFNFIVSKELFFRIFSPIFMFVFTITLSCFLLPKSYGRVSSLFSLSYLGFFCTLFYAIMSYGFLSEALIPKFCSIIPSVANLFLMFVFLYFKIQKS